MYDVTANAANSNETVERYGMTFQIVRKDPDGFFFIETDFPLPDKYSGAYTSVDEAKKAITVYVENLPKKVK